MSRRREDDVSSFELLLDTMCNTFGGIVFIALLLALLSRATGIDFSTSVSKEHAARQDLQAVEQSMEADRLTRRVHELEQLVGQREATQRAPGMDVGENLAQYSQLVASNQAAEAEMSRLKRELEEIVRETDALRREVERTAVTEVSLEEQARKLEPQISQALARAKRRVRLPRLHEVEGKAAVFFAVKNGKFYAVTDVSTAGALEREYDREDVRVESGPGLSVVELVASKGQAVVQGSESRGKLRQALNNLSPRLEFVNFAVYADSFAEFNYVKSLFVGKGFEYNWTPLEGSISISLTRTVHAQ